MSERLLLAIGSRLTRQTETASSISIKSMSIDKYDRRSARSFYSIMQVNPATVETLAVDPTEREDWELVARAMKLQPGAVREVVTSKPALDRSIRTRSSRNNIKDIWDAVGPRGFKIYTRNVEDPFVMCPRRNNCCEQVVKSQAGWARLQQILDMSQDEFAKK